MLGDVFTTPLLKLNPVFGSTGPVGSGYALTRDWPTAVMGPPGVPHAGITSFGNSLRVWFGPLMLKGLKMWTGTRFPLSSCVSVCEKSPIRSKSVGTRAEISALSFSRTRSRQNRKKVLPLMIGPVTANPYWSRVESVRGIPFRFEKKSLAFKAVRRPYHQPLL